MERCVAPKAGTIVRMQRNRLLSRHSQLRKQPLLWGESATAAQVQERLADLGYYDGLIDGIMGPQTRAAIGTYEGTHNLVVDGTISTRLLARMGLS